MDRRTIYGQIGRTSEWNRVPEQNSARPPHAEILIGWMACNLSRPLPSISMETIAPAVRLDSHNLTSEGEDMKKIYDAISVVALVVALGGSALLAQAPTDPQIVQIVQTANKIDINQAKLALKKSNNAQVKEFANQMISDHTNLEKSVADLAKKLNVTPQDSDTSKQLQQQAAAETKKLNSLSGKAFDKEYASHEVAFHQAVIDAATNTLIPNAKNPQLKSALEGAAPLLQGHEQHAKQLESSLQSGQSGK